MNKKSLLISGAVVVVLIGFFFFIYGDNDRWKVKLPVLNYTKPFSFTDQDGRTVTEKNVQGKVYVVEYFYTTCPGICPKMNANMHLVYNAYKNEPNFLILSHTVFPEIDSVSVLKRYSDSLQADSNKWLFLTGAKQALYNSARMSYLLDDPENNRQDISDQFIHTQFFALVDKSGRVRKIYDGLKTEDINRLKKDIAKLLLEKPAEESAEKAS